MHRPHAPLDEKQAALRAARALNPRPEAVVDPAFAGGDPFFDARDLVQVKYEMLRRVHVEGQAVTRAAAAFGFSRPSFYAAQAAWQQTGLRGLVPVRPGPRGGHKLTPAVVAFLAEERARAPTLGVAKLVLLVQERFGLVVHRRSVERVLARQAKGGAPSP
jgi:transposase